VHGLPPLHSGWKALPQALGALLACSSGAGGFGCGSPPPSDAADAQLIAPGEPSVELGFYVHGAYQPLSAAAEARVLWGSQGGTWTMPSVRLVGIGSPALVSGTLVLAPDGAAAEVLGRSAHEYQFARSADGALECRTVAVPVQHAPPRQFEAINDLYGRTATLSITASDAEGRSAMSSSSVTLVED
jgi:hypothetical protein